MQILPLLEKVHRQFLKAKRLRHFVMTEHFDAVWRSLTDDQQNDLLSVIDKGDVDEVRIFLNGLSEDMSTFSLTKLRVVARQYRIKNYYQLTRKNLIKEIEDVKDANRKSAT